MRESTFVLTGLALVFSFAPTKAGIVTFTDREAFLEAAGDVREIDFETLPDGSPSVPHTAITADFNYTSLGVSFSSPTPVLEVNTHFPAATGMFCLDAQAPSTSERNWIIADLVVPASAVGILFPGNTSLSVFDDHGNALGWGHVDGAGYSVFLGIVSDVPIGVAVADRGSSGEVWESFLFAPVPEPMSLVLVGLGAIGLRVRQRRSY